MYKKTTILFLLLATLWPAVTFSQDSTVKQLSPFTSVEVSTAGKIILTQDSVHTLRTEPADKSSDVNTTISGKTLSIHVPAGVTVYLSMKEIEELSIGGFGRISSESPIKSDNLRLTVNGSGKISLSQVDAKNIIADINGMGKIILAGKSESLDVNIPGSGKVDASALKTTSCKAMISGVGKCIVDVTDNLDVTISGSGTVNYINPPKNLSKSISGIGKIRPLDSGSDTTTISLGNKKIVISDEDDNEADDDNDGKDEKYYEKYKDWGDKWEDKWEKKFNKKKKKSSGNKPSWPGVEIGINGYADADYSTDLPQGLDYLDLDYGKSISFSVNFFDVRKKFFSRHLFLFTGLGITWNNYRFSNNITLNPNSTTVLASADSVDYSKNKLAASYLVAPAIVQVFFGNNRYKSFHISGGLMLGYKLASHTKQKYESDGKTVKTKVHDDFNMNPFRASLRVSAGYGSVSIFAERALTTLFKNDKGPVLYPFTAGIGFSFF